MRSSCFNFHTKKIRSLENYNKTFVCFLFPFLRSTLLRVIPKMSSTAVISFFGIVLVFGSLKCNANKTDLYILQMVASFDMIPCKGMTLAYDVAKNSSSFKSFFEKYEIKMNCSLIVVSSQLALWGRVSSFSFDKDRRHFCDILVREIEHRVYGKREIQVEKFSKCEMSKQKQLETIFMERIGVNLPIFV